MSDEKNPSIGSSPQEPVKLMRLAVDMRDCIIGLNPRSSSAKILALSQNQGAITLSQLHIFP